MIESFQNRQPGAPWWRIAFWHVMHFFCVLWMVPFYRYRSWGRHRIPETGPLLLVSNHQSLLDPILVGLACHHRQFYALARSSLFRHRFFAWLIGMLNAIPVERGSSDTAAMRKCIDMLQQGQALLIFPEGTRTRTGRTEAFSAGTMLVIKRAKPMVLPVAIEGAHDAWPREKKLPRLTGRIGVMYGQPIPAQQLLAMGSGEALSYLQDQVETMRQDLAERLHDKIDSHG